MVLSEYTVMVSIQSGTRSKEERGREDEKEIEMLIKGI